MREIKICHAKNSVIRALTAQGGQVTSLDDMKSRSVEYYYKLSSYELGEALILDLNVSFNDVIIVKMGAWMCRIPRMEEIKDFLFLCLEISHLDPME